MEGVGVAFNVFGINDILVESLAGFLLKRVGIKPGELPIQVGSAKRDSSKNRPNDEGDDQPHIQQHPHSRIPAVNDIQEDIDPQEEEKVGNHGLLTNAD
jgi:hypothetical protein